MVDNSFKRNVHRFRKTRKKNVGNGITKIMINILKKKNKNFTNNFTGDRVKMYIFFIYKINFVHFFFFCIANSRETSKVAFRNH